MLTYCTNIHPAESWDEVLTGVWPQVLEVKSLVSAGEPFPVGLRLSAMAASQVSEYRARQFLDICSEAGCFIPTINGFPYGSFHGPTVREDAYLPDWRDRRRVDYTVNLIQLLGQWLPQRITGSISTLPICYGRNLSKSELGLVRNNILAVLEELERAAWAGRRIVLAVEPEPGCFLETADDVVRFVEWLAPRPSLRPFFGVCFDCCHAAVMFEEPGPAFELLEQAGIPVAKIHLSSAVSIAANHNVARQFFADQRYLHQTNVLTASGPVHYPDLAAVPESASGEWRVHFHLPIFDGGNRLYGTTNDYIADVLAVRPADALLEIETYTYDVLPEAVASLPVSEFIRREFEWLRGGL